MKRWSLLLAAAFALPVLADVKMPAIFSNGMVLQREQAVKVWGTADAGEEVNVSFAGQSVTATTDADGNWTVNLEQLAANAKGAELVVKGKNKLTFTDVLVGDVWLCSGQSNMEWPLRLANNGKEEAEKADHPNIRLFTVTRKVSAEPLKNVEGKWEACSPKVAAEFSAVGYFFGLKLHKDLEVPIGLIDSSWGGTPAEAWTPHRSLEADGVLQPILERHAAAVEKLPESLKKYEADLAAWEKLAKENPAATRPAAPGTTPATKPVEKPRKPDPENQHAPSRLYNAMIAPIAGFPIRGVIWYQGESNAGRAEQYATLLPTLVRSWRDAWSQERFAFYIVQLANFRAPTDDPNKPSDWAELREAQVKGAEGGIEYGFVVTIDIGDEKDIHPRNKQEVGRRLALQALSKSYGKLDIVGSGPTYSGSARLNDTMIIRLGNKGGGLVAKGPDGKLSAENKITGFAIAGEDQKFHWAEATIENDTIVVRSDNVKEPAAVRYGWADNPTKANLFNAEGLPAMPFRTDEWPGITAGKR